MTYTHPHMKVARMEAAVEVLGSQIAKLSASIDDARHAPAPDDSLIESLMEQLIVLRDRQDDLRPDDVDAVAQILGNKAA